MVKDYYKQIKEQRVKNGFSQLYVAEKLDISRSSYIAFEQGKTDLSLSEASKLADIFGISLEEIKSGLNQNFEKYKQMILAFLRLESSKDGKIPKTKLAKLVYLSDFAWFYECLESMSGMSYRKIKFGPVPDSYFRAIEELFDEGSIDIDCKADAFLISQTEAGEREELSELGENEKKLIKKISNKWKGKRTQEIVKFTHTQLPYQICENNEIIPYELITQENPDHVY